MEKKLELVDGKYRYEDAFAIANALLEELKPHCLRIEIAGSIRRKKTLVSDIELVLVPLEYTTGVVESGIALVLNKFTKVKGEMQYGVTKYTRRILPEGIELDVFIAEEANWGYILALRTGSSAFNQKVLLSGLRFNGVKCVGGYLFRDGEKKEVREEIEVFRMAGILYKQPEERNL